MTKFHDKVEGRTKQIFGEMIGDGRLVSEGKEQIRKSELKPETNNRKESADSSNDR